MKKVTHIDGDFIWYQEKWEDVDLSKLESIGGSAYLRGYSGDLSKLESIGCYAYLQGYSGDLSKLESIGGYAYLRGYSGDLSKLPDDFKDVYIEYEENAITMKEYRKIRGIYRTEEMTLEEVCKELGRDIKIKKG